MAWPDLLPLCVVHWNSVHGDYVTTSYFEVTVLFTCDSWVLLMQVCSGMHVTAEHLIPLVT